MSTSESHNLSFPRKDLTSPPPSSYQATQTVTLNSAPDPASPITITPGTPNPDSGGAGSVPPSSLSVSGTPTVAGSNVTVIFNVLLRPITSLASSQVLESEGPGESPVLFVPPFDVTVVFEYTPL